MAPPTYEAPDWASVEADVSYVTPMNGEKLFRYDRRAVPACVA